MSKQTPVDNNSEIRVLHHMARSGGTLISKCLATMDNVVLLSEIHPAGTSMFNPLQQAHEWYGLFNQDDLLRIQQGSMSFIEAILLISDRCTEQGKILILRDWSHLDFIGLPFIDKPVYQLTLADVLRKNRSVINTATVRHPIYQWLSTSNLAVSEGLSLNAFLSGYRHFAEHCVNIDFIRYEDFTSTPGDELMTLCERLNINYDNGWRDRWWSYDKITGDTGSNNGRKGIKQPSYKKLDASLLKAFARNDDYQSSIELLGYKHL